MLQPQLAVPQCGGGRSGLSAGVRPSCVMTCMRSELPHLGHRGIVQAVYRTSLLMPQALHKKRHEMVSIESIWTSPQGGLPHLLLQRCERNIPRVIRIQARERVRHPGKRLAQHCIECAIVAEP
jgi:hypothetical protein